MAQPEVSPCAYAVIPVGPMSPPPRLPAMSSQTLLEFGPPV